jgi:hypothetical protein
MQLREQLTLTTPLGHEVWLDLDCEHFAVEHARVVHRHTGIIRTIDARTSATLARALQARHVYQHALSEASACEFEAYKLGASSLALGAEHPAVRPYHREAQQHSSIAQDMKSRSEHYEREAMAIIDALVGR